MGESSSGVGVNPISQDDNSANHSGTVYVFIRIGDVWSQQAYLKASNTRGGYYFGRSVSISGDTIVVGSADEGSDGVGVNPPQSVHIAPESGAAYIFVRTAGVWTQQAFLKASNAGVFDYFGWSVSVSGDTAVVGAYREASNGVGVNSPSQSDNSLARSGAAYVFIRADGEWSQQAYLKASNTNMFDLFGESVAVSGDTVVVGARGEDGNGVGVDPTSQSDNSASLSGAAYVFVRAGGEWSQQAYLKASNAEKGDWFGEFVAVSEDTVVVGARLEDGNGGYHSGAAYVFVRADGEWSQQAYLKASNSGAGDYFGRPVAVSGNTVVIGATEEDSDGVGVNPPSQADNTAYTSGAAYVYVRASGTWSQQAFLKGSNTDPDDRLGNSVAVSGDTVVIAAWAEASQGMGANPPFGDDDSVANSGAAYIFTGLGPPFANAGPDQLLYIPGGGTSDVILDGSASSNPVGNPLIYTWTGPFPEGGGTVMGEMPMVTLPPGIHTVTLTVDDGNLMDNDTVEITVIETTMADAGPDQLHQVPSGGTADVMLDGSGSSDLDMDMLTLHLDGTVPRGRRHCHGCDADCHPPGRDAQHYPDR